MNYEPWTTNWYYIIVYYSNRTINFSYINYSTDKLGSDVTSAILDLWIAVASAALSQELRH